MCLIERGADIFKQHSKLDPSPLEGAVKKKLKQVNTLIVALDKALYTPSFKELERAYCLVLFRLYVTLFL